MIETIGEMIDRIQSVNRFGRKPKPVVYIDMEVRSNMSMDPGRISAEDLIAVAYSVDGGPVHVLPWEAACARGDWAEADRLRLETFNFIRRQHQINYYDDLLWISKPWIVKKFLTLMARARTLLERSTDKPE